MRLRLRIVSLGAVVLLIAGHFWSLDGIPGNAFLFVVGDDTEYARGYSDTRFRGVQVGDSVDQLLSELGEPHEMVDGERDEGTAFIYSWSPGDTHFRQRVFWIVDGRVAQKTSRVWLD